jgi:flagellar protein FliL
VKKFLPIILGVLLIGGGYFGYTKFMGGGPVEDPVAAQQGDEKELAEAKKQRKKDKLEGPMVSLGDPFVVNLADPGLAAFTKFSVSLRVDKDTPLHAAGAHGGTEPPALEETPEIRDAVINVIGDKTSEELKSSEGREQVKDELIDEINRAAPKTLVLEVFFTDFAIQSG